MKGVFTIMKKITTSQTFFFFEIIKIGGLVECGILFDSDNHRADYVKKCSNEILVEICKSNKYLDVSNAHRF